MTMEARILADADTEFGAEFDLDVTIVGAVSYLIARHRAWSGYRRGIGESMRPWQAGRRGGS